MKKIFIVSLLLLLTAAGCNPLGGSSTQGVAKTTDGGTAWQLKNNIAGTNSSIGGLSVSEMAFAPGNSEKIYLGATNEGLWLSEDGADSWKSILSRISVNDFFVQAENAENIFAAGIYNNHGKIVRTTNGGASWDEVYNEASVKNAVNSITANPNNENELYAVLNSGLLIRSNDAGSNWFVVYNFNEQVVKLRFNKLAGTMYALLRHKGLAKSSDNGKTWQFITQSLTPVSASPNSEILSFVSSGIDSYTKVAFDDQTAGVIFVTTSAGLYKTLDDGKQWLFLNLPVKGNAQSPRAIASSKGGMLAYTSIGNTVFRSADGGLTWQTQLIPSSGQINKFLINPELPQIAYLGLIGN